MALILTNPVIVKPADREDWRAMQDWCEEFISAGGKTWMTEVSFGMHGKTNKIYFMHEEDATLFKLKWL